MTESEFLDLSDAVSLNASRPRWTRRRADVEALPIPRSGRSSEPGGPYLRLPGRPYDKTVDLHLCKGCAAKKKFSGVEELKARIADDARLARRQLEEPEAALQGRARPLA